MEGTSIRELLFSKLDPSDPGHRDPEFIREQALPFLNWIREHYFRAEGEGMENTPREGSFISVGNHNGGPILADAWVMLSYWWTELGIDRPAYCMVHDAPLQTPVLGNILSKLGAIRASPENAAKILNMKDGALLIYPGGELDCLRSPSAPPKCLWY